MAKQGSASARRRGRRAARRAAGPPAGPSSPATGGSPPGADQEAAERQRPEQQHPEQQHREQRPERQRAEQQRAEHRSRPAAGSPADAPPAPVVPSATPSPPSQRSGRKSRRRSDSAAERSLRSLVTTRPTQLSPTAAMRAREVAIPTAEDLAAAGEGLVLIRRNYVPPTPLNTGRRGSKSGGRRGRGPRTDQDGNSGGSGSAS